MNFRALVLLLSFLLFGACTNLFSQETSGRLHGEVIDPTGAVIPGATITLKNSSGLSVTAKSDAVGSYDLKGLAPGKYTLTVAAQGFTAAAQNVVVTAGQDRKLDLALAVKGQEEQVVVEGEGAKVSTNPDANASTLVISGKDLDALSDDPDELQSELQALAGPSAGPNGGQMYIDGFTGGQLPPKSSIREIRINQNPFSAQYDRMGFGRIEILTKPGTDKLHGQVFYNDNHSIFDAMNPFAAAEAPFDSEIINGNIGGPLGKKASYFFNFERRNINDAAVISANAFSAAGLQFVAVDNPRVRTGISGRLDYQLTPGNTLTARYQFTHNHEENDGVSQLALPSQAYNQALDEHSIQISDTQVLSPRAVNETRFEYEHTVSDLNSLSALPVQNVLGHFIQGGNSIGVSAVTDNHIEVQNYSSMNIGSHFLRFGGRLRLTSETNDSTQNFNGTFTFGAIPDVSNPGGPPIDPLTAFKVLKTPSQFTVTKTGASGTSSISNTFADTGIYAEDDWKVRPNMTLSYGLRFETQTGIGDRGDWAPRVGFAWGVDAKKNAPAKTIIRTGFGLFYDRFAQNLILQTERLNGINQQQYTFTIHPTTAAADEALLAGLYANYPTLPDVRTLGLVPRVSTYSINPSLRAPYTEQAVGSLERQLTKTSTVTVSYIHSHGVHQLFNLNCQAMAAGTCAALVAPALPAGVTAGQQYVYMSEGVFKQNQLITSFNMRAGTRLTIFSYYSLSYANGDSSGPNSSPSNPLVGITGDYGRTAFDVRNRLFFGGTIGLPRGFRVSPFMVANSGPPFNITLGQDLNGDALFNDRPAFASSSTAAADQVATRFGNFDVNPGANDPRIPINFGTTPAQFTFNVRLAKTFGLGPRLESVRGNQGNQQAQDGRGPAGGGPGRGVEHGPGGGEHGPGGGGPGRGAGGPGPGGPMGGMFAGERSNQRYSLTFSANARNLFNNVNPGNPIGNLSAGTAFGTYTSLAGGVFNTQSANRRIDFQVMFAF